MTDKYNTISSPSQGLFKDNGSRFIAYAYPIVSESEVKPIVEALRKEHHAARHHCYAYRLAKVEEGPDGPYLSAEGIWRANDDGEPSGTAGKQILGQIDSAGLRDVLVVVVRYFGGILLGVPGLIRAYKTSTADALANATVVERTASRRYRIEFTYDQMPSLEKALKNYKLKAENREFFEECSLETQISLSKEKDFFDYIEKIGIFKSKIEKL